MTTLAQSTSITLTVADDARVAIASNGGIGSYTITQTAGAASIRNFGPDSLRQVIGPFPEGAVIVLTNTNCASFDYEASGGYNPSSVNVTGGTFKADDGTAALPSYSFASFPGSGAFLTAGGGLAWAVSGVSRLWLSTLQLFPSTTGVLDLGAVNFTFKRLYIDFTNTGTVGAVTINKASGRVNIAAAGTSVVVTNSLCTANAHVFPNLATVDATAKSAQITPGAGSFTVTLNAAATAQVAIDFFIVNAD